MGFQRIANILILLVIENPNDFKNQFKFMSSENPEFVLKIRSIDDNNLLIRLHMILKAHKLIHFLEAVSSVG